VKAGGGERSNVAPRLGFAVSNDNDAPPSSPPAAVPAIANPYTRSSVIARSNETGAIFSVNYENDIYVTNAHITADLPVEKRRDDDAPTAAPTAEDVIGIECTLLEANKNDSFVDEPKTQENEMNDDGENQQFGLNKDNEDTLVDVNLDHDDVNGENLSNRCKIFSVDNKTQETLTMMESEIENYDEYSQDERFSQLSEKLIDEAPTQIPSSQGGRFSQTQDDRFSQLDNTADEQISQFTR
jgi:hypothetical protein